jgi:hypothetical protein
VLHETRTRQEKMSLSFIRKPAKTGSSEEGSFKSFKKIEDGMKSLWSVVRRKVAGTAQGSTSVLHALEPPKDVLTIVQLHEMTSYTRAEEAECLQRLKLLDEDTSLERQLGESMISRKWSLSDMLKAWDKNGDLQIQRMEFRLAVKTLMGIDATHTHCDALFDKLDLDAGGSLDEAELKQSFKLMHDAARAARADHTHTSARLDYCRQRLKLLDLCEEPTRLAEAAHAVHTMLCKTPPLDARVGQALRAASPHASVVDLAAKWDGDGTGRISLHNFLRIIKGLKNLGQLRVDGSSAEVDAQLTDLYHSLCDHLSAGKGDASVPIMATIKAMLDAAKEVPSRIAKAAQELARVEKVAREVQERVTTLDVAEKIKWDDARMQERRARAEIEAAREEQRRRREAKASQRAAEAEAAEQEKQARRDAQKGSIDELGGKAKRVRKSSNPTRLAEEPPPPQGYLASWAMPKPVEGKGKKAKKSKAKPTRLMSPPVTV